MARRNRCWLSRGTPFPQFSRVALTAAIVGLWLASSQAWAAPPSPPVAIDRDLQQPFAEAQALIGRGLFTDAMRLLQPILGDSQNKLAFLGGRYVDAKVAANRLIGTFPPTALAAYEKEFGKEANDDLQRAQAAGKVEDVLRVFATYRHTAAGPRALAVAAGIFFDRGQFMEAAAASRQLLDLPDVAEQPSAAARLVLSWMRLGAGDQARRWIDGRRTALAKSEIEVEGRRYPLDRWLDELLRPVAASASAVTKSAPTAGGHAQTLAPWNTRSPTTLSLWTKRLSGTGTSGGADRRTDRPAGRFRHRSRFSRSATGRRRKFGGTDGRRAGRLRPGQRAADLVARCVASRRCVRRRRLPRRHHAPGH